MVAAEDVGGAAAACLPNPSPLDDRFFLFFLAESSLTKLFRCREVVGVGVTNAHADSGSRERRKILGLDFMVGMLSLYLLSSYATTFGCLVYVVDSSASTMHN